MILLDIGHQEVKELIEEHFPTKYKIEFFVELEELQPNSIVVLHPEVEYEREKLKADDYECVYMLGHTRKVPTGAIRITHDDLL